MNSTSKNQLHPKGVIGSPVPQITHVIFDLDGLLLDTEPIIARVVEDFAEHHGQVLPSDVHMRRLGIGVKALSHILSQELDLKDPDAYLKWREPRFRQLFPKSPAKPGSEKLVTHLHNHSIPMAITTSSPRDMHELKIQQHSWFSHIAVTITANELGDRPGKPTPDPYLITAEKLEANPQRCLVFEDAPSGVESAHAAGMSVVAVPSNKDHPERYKNADQIIASLEDFKPEDWGLPTFNS